MTLDIVFSLYHNTEAVAESLNSSLKIKDFIPAFTALVVLTLTFLINNWWNIKEKHNEDLKIKISRTEYLLDILDLSIKELEILLTYYDSVINSIKANPEKLPNKKIIVTFFLNKFLEIKEPEIYFKIFKHYNKMLQSIDDTLKFHKAIFDELYSSYLEIEKDERQTFYNASKTIDELLEKNFTENSVLMNIQNDFAKKLSETPLLAMDIKFIIEYKIIKLQKELENLKPSENEFVINKLMENFEKANIIYHNRKVRYNEMFRTLPNQMNIIKNNITTSNTLKKDINNITETPNNESNLIKRLWTYKVYKFIPFQLLFIITTILIVGLFKNLLQ